MGPVQNGSMLLSGPDPFVKDGPQTRTSSRTEPIPWFWFQFRLHFPDPDPGFALVIVSLDIGYREIERDLENYYGKLKDQTLVTLGKR